jgi:hypothetical protein
MGAKRNLLIGLLNLVLTGCDPVFFVSSRLSFDSPAPTTCVLRGIREIPNTDIIDHRKFCDHRFKDQPTYNVLLRRPDEEPVAVAVWETATHTVERVEVFLCGMGFRPPAAKKRSMETLTSLLKSRIGTECGVVVHG